MCPDWRWRVFVLNEFCRVLAAFYLRKQIHDLVSVLRADFFFNNIFQEISLSIVLCLFIHNIGSKHDRETITSKLTFMLLILQASLLR